MTERLSTHSIVDPTQFFSNLTRVTLYNLTLSKYIYIERERDRVHPAMDR